MDWVPFLATPALRTPSTFENLRTPVPPPRSPLAPSLHSVGTSCTRLVSVRPCHVGHLAPRSAAGRGRGSLSRHDLPARRAVPAAVRARAQECWQHCAGGPAWRCGEAPRVEVRGGQEPGGPPQGQRPPARFAKDWCPFSQGAASPPRLIPRPYSQLLLEICTRNTCGGSFSWTVTRRLSTVLACAVGWVAGGGGVRLPVHPCDNVHACPRVPCMAVVCMRCLCTYPCKRSHLVRAAFHQGRSHAHGQFARAATGDVPEEVLRTACTRRANCKLRHTSIVSMPRERRMQATSTTATTAHQPREGQVGGTGTVLRQCGTAAKRGYGPPPTGMPCLRAQRVRVWACLPTQCALAAPALRARLCNQGMCGRRDTIMILARAHPTISSLREVARTGQQNEHGSG
jgi:hypothetical protein